MEEVRDRPWPILDEGMQREEECTHVIQAWLSAPNASCHAGSRDWKYSSGWKKVHSVNAFTMRKASSNANIPSAEESR